VWAVRKARPQAWLGVDGNQGFSAGALKALIPILLDADVQLIEQPLRVGEEDRLRGNRPPMLLVADESFQGLDDLPGLVGRFDVVNIKLDKCGGLTEGLAIAKRAAELGLKRMVGCMAGTSLAMAPAFILGQQCEFVDLDAPLGLTSDREPCALYEGGYITCPPELWGAPASVT
jgi:L-alanine-DL-glutamate epimerase-like enolase superfamily enzyme